MRLLPLSVLLVATPLAAAPAPDTFTIRLGKEPAPGQSYTVRSTDKLSSTTIITNPLLGKPLDPQKTGTEQERVFTDTILEKPTNKDDPVKKFKRAYTKARDMADGKTTPQPYEGRTVVFEWKDGRYRCTAEGEPKLDPKVLDDLAQQETGTPAPAGSERLLLPGRPVKVGEKWTVAGKELLKVLPKDDTFVLDSAQSSCEGTLVRAYAKGSKQYGVIELRMKFAIKKTGDLTFDKPATMDTTLTVDGVIDGSSGAATATHVMKMRGRGYITEDGKKVTVDIFTEQSGRQERSPEK